MIKKFFNSEYCSYIYIIFGVFVVLLYMLPYFILGENSYITIHDFIEQNVALMVEIKNAGLLTSIDGVVPNMEGLPRWLFPYYFPLDFKMLCYNYLPTCWAIIIYTTLFKIISFLGLFLLVDNYIFKGEYRYLSLLLGLAFSFISFYVELSLGSAGIPLLTYAFLNLYNKKRILASYLLILLFTFNSLLAYGGFFAMFIIALVGLWQWYKTKEFPKHVAVGFVLMGCIYLLMNIGTFYSLFFADKFISHRSVWVHSNSFIETTKEFLQVVLFGQYHAGSFVAFAGLLGCLFAYTKYRKNHPELIYFLSIYVLITTLIYCGALMKMIGIQVFITVQFDRFYMLYAGVCFALFAETAFILMKECSRRTGIIYLLLVCASVLPYTGSYRQNIKLLAGREISHPTYKEFFDVALFNKIKKDLELKDDYSTKVTSLGMYPSIAGYNYLWTVDAYRVNYQLEFKNKFRNVIAKELEKSEEIKSYYDGWGSRCYIFSSELGLNFLYGKNSEIREVNNLEINTEALRDLGCAYIISAVKINNADQLNIEYVNTYTTPESFWELYVYKI